MTDDDVLRIVSDFTQRGIVPSDSQAMALVKRFDLSLCPRQFDEQGRQRHTVILHGKRSSYSSQDADLNRAIVECVAKMQQAKVRGFGGSVTVHIEGQEPEGGHTLATAKRKIEESD